MKNRFSRTVCVGAWLLVGLLVESQADDEKKKDSGDPDLSGSKVYEGFFDFFWNEKEGKIWLKLDQKFDQPFLYVTSLATGLGSNPVGLDRGQLGSTRLVKFRKVGQQVFLEQINVKFRANTRQRAEQRAVADSFANSIIWAGNLKRSTEDGLLTDITSLLIRDAHDAVGKLSGTGQGDYSFNRQKSFVYLPRTAAFPRNCEFEAAVTLESKKPGRLAELTAASGASITLRQHHSFVRLPNEGYLPRKHDPRCGSFAIVYQDYSVPLDQNIEQRFITRHRLVKKNPTASKSEPVQPIVYYVDSGVPSPVKEALIEGASWWNDAFENAGFVNAFQVKELPHDVDPMDVRYNVIQWVHRATRGWSYGQSVIDPRTGEIIKGHVLLGSLRIRQDLILNRGLLGNRALEGGLNQGQLGFCSSCQPTSPSLASLTRFLSREDGLDVALARIRQLSAHEVGHTLGFAHNFAASTYGDRASVMDYPAPQTKIVDGRIDLTGAYGVGVGSWDQFLVKFAYTQFSSPAKEIQGLDRLVKDAIKSKLVFLSDADSRPRGAAHPLASLWDNGADPLESLKHEINVRRIALNSFSEKLIPVGVPMSELEKTFVPMYLHHRYQLDATSKMIGGVEYSYAVRGDGQILNRPVEVARQQEALDLLLRTLAPEFLEVPVEILKIIPPKAFSSPSDRERFASRTSPVFDIESAIEVASHLTIANLLQHQRLARVEALNHNGWDTAAILEKITRVLFLGKPTESLSRQKIRRITQSVFVHDLIQLAGRSEASLDVIASANYSLNRLRKNLLEEGYSNRQNIHFANLVNMIDHHFSRPGRERSKRNLLETPPGSPIGSGK